eukprot:25178-Pelagococcus_subviridis.AAC.7
MYLRGYLRTYLYTYTTEVAKIEIGFEKKPKIPFHRPFQICRRHRARAPPARAMGDFSTAARAHTSPEIVPDSAWGVSRSGRSESSARGCGKEPEIDFAIDRKSLPVHAG